MSNGILLITEIEQLVRDTVAAKIIQGDDIEPKDWIGFARAIEQAVLQSEQVQALRKKAARYDWLRQGDNDELVLCNGPVNKDYWYLPRNEKLDDAIDDVMGG